MASRTEPKTKKKWRPAPDDLIQTFETALDSFREAEKRKMFGYPCSFINGQMFAGLHQENMVLRLFEEDRFKFLELDGARPFEPMAGRIMREYVVVPQSILDSEDRLNRWLERAFAYAKSLPQKPPKGRGSKKAKGH